MALPPPIVLPQAASFRLIITQTLPLIFPNTRLLIIALGPLLAAADANNGLIPAGPAGVALQAGLAFAGWFFRLEFNRFIQRYVLGIGWPAVLAANDPRLTRWATAAVPPPCRRPRARCTAAAAPARHAEAAAFHTTSVVPHPSAPSVL